MFNICDSYRDLGDSRLTLWGCRRSGSIEYKDHGEGDTVCRGFRNLSEEDAGSGSLQRCGLFGRFKRGIGNPRAHVRHV